VDRLIVIDSVDVGERRIEARLRVCDPKRLSTSAFPRFAERITSLLPGLARHSCENEDGLDFMRELRDTELAHCVEHVTAELMALAGSPRTLRGETRWDFAADGAGIYRVSLSYDDDLVALAALSEGVAAVEWAAGLPGGRPDIEAISQRLRALRGVLGA